MTRNTIKRLTILSAILTTDRQEAARIKNRPVTKMVADL